MDNVDAMQRLSAAFWVPPPCLVCVGDPFFFSLLSALFEFASSTYDTVPSFAFFSRLACVQSIRGRTPGPAVVAAGPSSPISQRGEKAQHSTAQHAQLGSSFKKMEEKKRSHTKNRVNCLS